MDAGDHHIELGEQLVLLIERSVFEDVDFDPGEDAKRRELGIQLADHIELLA